MEELQPQTAISIDWSSANKKFSILHVDDDIGFLAVSKQILEKDSKFQVDIASNVEEAFRKMTQKKYDTVISDYEMPYQNGLLFFEVA